MRTIRFRLALCAVAGMAVAFAGPLSFAQEKKEPEKKDEKKEPAKEEVKKDEKKEPEDTKKKEAKPAGPELKHLVSNLEHPSGLAIHEQTGHVFIASRYGVYRYDPTNKQVFIEIAGYPTDVYGKGPKYDIGPLGLAFLGGDQLIVGDGSRPDGEELVRIYKVSAKPPEQWQKEESAQATLGPIPKTEGKTETGEGNFYGVAVAADKIFVTANGDDTYGWVATAEVKDGKPGKLELTIATKKKIEEKTGTGIDAPGAAAVSPEGDLVISQKGEVNLPGDSLLTFYDPKSGDLKKVVKTGLSDVVGVAYSPKTKKLYVTDFSWVEPEKGGLFEVAIDGDTAQTKKVVGLDKPTAITFDKEGRLYLTQFGTKAEDDKSDKSPGGLYAIEPGL